MTAKFSDFQQQIFDQHQDQMGLKIMTEFHDFLREYNIYSINCNYSYTVDPSDPNYGAYAEGVEEGHSVLYYQMQAERLRADEKATMFIDYSHIQKYKFKDSNFNEAIVIEYHRYEPYLRKALTQFMYELNPVYAKDRFFQVGFYNLPHIQKIRDLKSTVLGRLMSIHGTVTRTTEVKPELNIGSFKCMECNSITQGIEQQFKFTEPVRCSNEKCGNKTKWELINSDSVFMDWQKLRLQEHSGDIPAGSMPRSVEIILRGEIVDKAKPGDRSIFTGNLVVVPDIVQLLKPGDKPQASTVNTAKMKRNDQKNMDGVTGLKRLGVKDLSYKLVFIANSVHAADSRFGFSNVVSADEEEKQQD